jgi:nicotinate-nucleotide pyrophosphorylase (carboxylating)
MMGDLAYAVQRVRAHAEPDARIEVQCRSPGQVRAALAAGADVVLLDGMSPLQVRECVELVAGRAKVNAAAGITLDTVRNYAHAGVDHVSIAGIVQEAGPLELTLEMETA